MKRDIHTSLQFMKLFPHQFKIVQYEDITNLDEKARILYKFVGMRTASSFKEKLHELKGDGIHSYSYRQSLPWETVTLMNKYCTEIYEYLGYPIYKNKEDYLNTTLNFTSTPFSFTLS